MNKKNKDNFFVYVFIDIGRIIDVLSKEPSLMTTPEELKVDRARDEWKKLIAQGWRRSITIWKDF